MQWHDVALAAVALPMSLSLSFPPLKETSLLAMQLLMMIEAMHLGEFLPELRVESITSIRPVQLNVTYLATCSVPATTNKLESSRVSEIMVHTGVMVCDAASRCTIVIEVRMQTVELTGQLSTDRSRTVCSFKARW